MLGFIESVLALIGLASVLRRLIRFWRFLRR